MTRFILKKMLVAVALHLLLLSFELKSKATIDVGSSLLSFLWLTGIVYSASHYLLQLENRINTLVKVSIISFLAVGRGTVGLFCLIIYLIYYLTLGWIYGLYLLVFDIIITKRLADQEKRKML